MLHLKVQICSILKVCPLISDGNYTLVSVVALLSFPPFTHLHFELLI